MSLIKKRFYFYNFFKAQNDIPPFYGSITTKESHTVLYDSLNVDSIKSQSICKVNHVPNYLQICYNLKYNFNVKVINRDVGYAIDLRDFEDINSYVNRQFKKGRTIRKYVKRLENTFNIRYRRYYGDIPRSVYEDLLSHLYTMVEKRFKQLNDVNQQISDKVRWQTTLEETYSLIKEKRASLFVIYDDDKPIVISIAHHWGSVFYYVMCSFDTDYSKFGLGHLNFYKQIEWCISEDYEIIDTGPGEYHYKKRWSNKTYNLLQHIIYKENDLKSILLANVETVFTLIKKTLELLSLKPHVKLIKRKLAKKNNESVEYSNSFIYPEDICFNNYYKINYDNNDFSFLRKAIFDFLYAKAEHKKDVEVFKHLTLSKYIFKGKNIVMQYNIL